MKKYSERDGYGIYTTDFQATDTKLTKLGHKIAENSAEIVMLALFAGMVVGTGYLLQTTALAADTLIEYVEHNEQLAEDNFQLQQVLEAVEEQRARKMIEENAEQPPYWTVPEESY